jgi:predicted TIM-barrel fold metal-dependent hydrolase
MGFIDAHVHVWSDDLAHYPLAKGWTKEDMKPSRFTPEDLFKHTKPAGVDRINLIQMSYFYPKDLTKDHVGFDNKYMLDMIMMYPDVFVGTAVIDPLADGAEKLMGDLATKGVRAFRINPRLSRLPPAKWLEPDGYNKMFTAGAKNNQAMSCLIDPDAIPEIDRMCKKHPDTPVIIDHLARIGANGKIEDKDVESLCGLAKHQRVMIKVGAFYALGMKKPPYTDLSELIKAVVKAFGAKRCMWESDCPFQVVDHKYSESLDLVKSKLDFLTDDDKEWLLKKTAEEFFFKKK